MASVRSFRDLAVWQKARKLAALTYGLAKLMPRQEEYRLTSQMLRAVASVPANIAEGHMRNSRRDYARFVSISRGSLAELETYIVIALDVGLLRPADTDKVLELADEIGRMLTSLHQRLESPPLNGFSEDPPEAYFHGPDPLEPNP